MNGSISRMARLALLLFAGGLMLLVAAACDDDEGDKITGSGTVEARTVAVTSDTGGRVLERVAEEGLEVAPGDVIVTLDPVLLSAAIDEAKVAVQVAETRLDQLQAGARPEEVRAAEAQLSQAMAMWDGARRGWENAQAVLANPSAIDDQVNQAGTVAALAQVAVTKAEADLRIATAVRDALPAGGAQRTQADRQVEGAEAVLAAARAGQDGAVSALTQVEALREDPREVAAAVEAAAAAYRQADAAAEAAQEAVALVRSGPTDEQTAAAEATVRGAQAMLDALRAQQEALTLTAPITGTVVSVNAEPGELVRSGMPVARVADLDAVEITVFVPEDEIARLEVGQAATVEVDAFEDETFDAVVAAIATEAEFTPRNVQTEDQRANLVIAVRVRLDNSDRRLKLGMPAEVTIELE